jgi:hypothetical protein
VGEGEKPGLEGAQRGIGRLRVPRNLHPHVNTHCLVGEISRGVGVKHRDSIILWVYLSLVGVNPSISLLFSSKIDYVFEKFLFIFTRNHPHVICLRLNDGYL